MATREIVQLRDKETGDINEIRDKALKEAAKSSTPSDATNNSVIPLETEDGETIKIKAESLMKAFATMINSNSKSTITTLFGALTADNNTEFGAINMANLASVLGGHGFRTVKFIDFGRTHESFVSAISSVPNGCAVIGTFAYTYGTSYFVFGIKANSEYQAYAGVTYSSNSTRVEIKSVYGVYGGSESWSV